MAGLRDGIEKTFRQQYRDLLAASMRSGKRRWRSGQLFVTGGSGGGIIHRLADRQDRPLPGRGFQKR